MISWLCDRTSVYRLYTAGMAICAVSTVVTGLAGGLAALVAMRLLLGLGESVAFPGSSKIIARHVPPQRRGIANASVGAALALGPAAGTFVGGLILASYGWRAIFVVFGLVTLIWILPWQIATRGHEQDAKTISEPRFPTAKLLRHWSLWAMSVGHFIGNYAMYFMMTWLPLYLVQSRGFSITSMTFLTTLVFLAQAASSLAIGWVSDLAVANGRAEGPIRKAILAVGAAGVALGIFGAAKSSSVPLMSFWLVFAGISQGFKTSNLLAVAQMFAGPRGAGTWVGIQNTIANFAGMIGPVVTGLIIDHTGSYQLAFYLTGALALFGALWWYIALPRIEQISLD